MNPALILLPLLSLAGLLWRRHEAARAWVWLSLAATLFLGPVLVLPDGVPSPAGAIAAIPPWQGMADPAAGNGALRDVGFTIQPWLLHLRARVRAGQLPLWNPHQLAGSPFWSNGQSAPLFPLHLLFALLPVQLGLVLLPWLRITVAALGAWALARQLGASFAGGLVAGLAFPLAGMMSSFLLFPMANALCLVPWILWATERVAGAGASARPLAALVALQAVAGHPETLAHTLLLSGLYLLVRRCSLSSALSGAWAWTVGVAIAAVQVVPLTLNLLLSRRWQLAAGGEAPPWADILRAPLRWLLPDLWGNPATETWFGPFNYNATAVFAGIVTLLLAVGALRHRPLGPRLRALLALLVFSLLAAYQAPGLRHLLQALPLVGKTLLHRLLFGADLALAVLAAFGLDRWRRGERLLPGWSLPVLAAALAVAWWTCGDAWRRQSLVAVQAAWTLWALAAWFLVRRLPRRSWAAALLTVLVGGELFAAHGRTNPALRAANLYPTTPALEFLARRPGRVVGVGSSLRPNLALAYGLDDVRGEDAAKSARFDDMYSQLADGSSFFFRPIRDWSSPWLDRLAVRWVLAPPGFRSPQAGWRLVYDGPDARVYERPTAFPRAYWPGGSGNGLEIRRPRPERISVRVAAAAGRRLVVSEAWNPGWRATVAGRRLEVSAADGFLLDVALPEPVPGEAFEIELTYRPWGLDAGLALSLAGLLLWVFAPRSTTARSPRAPRPDA